uniref:Uncharacterized protein n=1 Tax=Heterorhabditis bacteriophora TaxID=37862 RepID=A0A1I7WGR8_HETBA
MENRVVDQFSKLKTIGASVLDKENADAWNKLNKFAFRLSHSKAPDVLNEDRISATRYILLSNTKAITLDQATPADERKALELSAQRSELCYNGHSTLLYPSRLWQDWVRTDDLFSMADLWLLTLGKRGCLNMLKTGAIGLAQVWKCVKNIVFFISFKLNFFNFSRFHVYFNLFGTNNYSLLSMYYMDNFRLVIIFIFRERVLLFFLYSIVNQLPYLNDNINYLYIRQLNTYLPQ